MAKTGAVIETGCQHPAQCQGMHSKCLCDEGIKLNLTNDIGEEVSMTHDACRAVTAGEHSLTPVTSIFLSLAGEVVMTCWNTTEGVRNKTCHLSSMLSTENVPGLRNRP